MRRVMMVVMALLSALVVAPAAIASGGTFGDDDGSVHEVNIEALFAAGITKGCGPGLYCPDDPVTRGQMAA
ncbi:MAG: S-layer homology domain-containing protein, partial [Acidimicrobiia bacterium]